MYETLATGNLTTCCRQALIVETLGASEESCVMWKTRNLLCSGTISLSQKKELPNSSSFRFVSAPTVLGFCSWLMDDGGGF